MDIPELTVQTGKDAIQALIEKEFARRKGPERCLAMAYGS
jgi:hypothetical protein